MYSNSCNQEINTIVFNKKNTTPSPSYVKASTMTHEQSVQSKLASNDEPIALKKLSLESRTLIQQSRIKNKWSQKELANKVNVTDKIINELESGKMKNPPPALINKLNNVLKMKIKLVT